MKDAKFACTDGKEYTLEDLKGHHVVMYFYPKDNTPGCTMEAIEFSALMDEFDKLGVKVIGVSKDGLKSHENFTKKHELKVPLLADPDKKLLEHFDALGEKNMFGKKVMGTIRSTVVLNPEGEIIKHYPKVKSKGHAQEVLDDMKAMLSHE